MKKIDNYLLAPCGVNCGTCVAHLRDKKKCNGCNGNDENKPYHCTKCRIKFCDIRLKNHYEYCSQCEKKCQRMKQLDKRYIKNYNISLLDNLERIRTIGIEKFMIRESEKWTCPNCGGIICQHTKICSKCHLEVKHED